MVSIGEKIKTHKNKIIKTILTIFGIISAVFIMFLILIVLSLLGLVDNYIYLKINNDNRNEITTLLKQQEDEMFNKSVNKSFENCYKKLYRIEMVHLFPDGEDYTMYCGKEKIVFSIDSSNYELSTYIGKNGHQWFKVR